MDIGDVAQYKVAAYLLVALGAILVLAVVFLFHRMEMRNVRMEKLRDRNAVIEILIKICVAKFRSGDFTTVNECTEWLQKESTEMDKKGHTVLGPTDYYSISVKAKQRYASME
ncbi:hypothetical protein [Vibrio phage BONAISHI]|nr:hypothetical protein [Vibrio phage BONAISHI]